MTQRPGPDVADLLWSRLVGTEAELCRTTVFRNGKMKVQSCLGMAQAAEPHRFPNSIRPTRCLPGPFSSPSRNRLQAQQGHDTNRLFKTDNFRLQKAWARRQSSKTCHWPKLDRSSLDWARRCPAWLAAVSEFETHSPGPPRGGRSSSSVPRNSQHPHEPHPSGRALNFTRLSRPVFNKHNRSAGSMAERLTTTR